jgi:hypothetical protein
MINTDSSSHDFFSRFQGKFTSNAFSGAHSTFEEEKAIAEMA